MIEKFRILWEYVKFLLKSRSVFRIHSPFIYSLYTEVLMKHASNSVDHTIRKVEELAADLYSCKDPLQLSDVGEKSRIIRNSTVGRRAKTLSQSVKGGRILHRLVRKFGHGNVLELGTGAGVSALYMAAASEDAQIFSIEGNSVMANIARGLIMQSGFPNITIYDGLFDDVLPEILKNLNELQVVFIDGDHKSESLFRYYDMISPFLKENSVVVLHDIYWSADMQKAWKTLIARPEVSISVDIFHFGMLFYHKGTEKQHFVLRV